ncbi:MAG: hypothetical protein K0Q73_8804 [Paenibacillus sp.]|jgi:hypothetical protein|nr:hypothetical protein [Paenibacillus sp.]
MDKSLLQRIIAEKLQLMDHANYGTLHEYIDDEHTDLILLLNTMADYIIEKEMKRHAA